MPELPTQYPSDSRMRPKEAADYIGFSVKTLAEMRSQGRGPSFIKLGGSRIFYYREDLDAWLEHHTRCTSTAQARFTKTQGEY